jgi:hypothetical protein
MLHVLCFCVGSTISYDVMCEPLLQHDFNILGLAAQRIMTKNTKHAVLDASSFIQKVGM